MKVAIVGAGISGLFLTRQLIKTYKDIEVHVFEHAKAPGGKLRSVCQNGEVLEKGPWRIATTHHKMLELMKADVNDIPNKKYFWYPTTQSVKVPEYSKDADLSIFAARMLDYGIEGASEMDILSGYMGIDEQPAECLDRHGGKFFGLRKGYAYIIKHLYIQLKEHKCIHWHCATMVKDVHCQDSHVFVRAMSISTGACSTQFFDKLIFACSPNQASVCSGRQLQMHLRPLKSAIKPLPLCRIYRSRMTEDFSDTINPSKIEYRQINVNEHHNIYSYTTGKLADAWRGIYAKYLSTNSNFKHYFWPEGTHMWRSFFNSCTSRMARLSVTVTKNVFIAGEAVSDMQGWSEGALRSCDGVLSVIDAVSIANTEWKQMYEKNHPGSRIVFYKQRAIDVSQWQHLHPGGPEIIQNIETYAVGLDISDRFDNAHLNDHAFGQLFALQVGFN